jgi:hypothetical protein
MMFLNKCLFLEAYFSLSAQSGNFWMHSRYWTWAWFNEGQCVVRFDGRHSDRSFVFWRTYGLLTLLQLWWRTLLCIMSLWEVFQLDGAPPHFSNCERAFLDREFPELRLGRGGPIPWLLILQLCLLWIFSSGWFVWVFLSCKVQDLKELLDIIIRAAECLNLTMFASTGQETEYRLDVCCATNGAILRSAEHIRNFVRSSVWKYIDFSNIIHGWRYIMVLFSFKFGHSVYITISLCRQLRYPLFTCFLTRATCICDFHYSGRGYYS